ncbi:MAG: protein-arginine deiminase family protein, partial [bacterium]
RYAMKINGSTFLTNAAFGTYASSQFGFVRGCAYTVTVEHVAHNTNWAKGTDFDYYALVDGWGKRLTNQVGDLTGDTWYTNAAKGLLIYDPDEILGEYWTDGVTATPYFSGKSAILYALKVDVDVDTDRDGVVEDTDDESGEEAWTINRGAFTIPASVSSLYTNYNVTTLPTLVVRGGLAFPAGHKLRFFRPSSSSALLLLDAVGTVVMGTNVVPSNTYYQIPGPYPLTNDLIYYNVSRVSRTGTIGSSAFEYQLGLQEIDSATNVVCTDTVLLKVAPLILPWDGDAVESVYADSNSVSATITNIPNLILLPATTYQFLQDYVKFTKAQFADTNIADIVVDLKDLNYGPFVKNICPATGELRRVEWNVTGNGGNIIVTPPLANAPYGKVIVGDKYPSAVPYIAAQGIQTNVITTVPTSWLEMGHADEGISFVTSNKILIPDPWTAADIIHAAITNGQGTNKICFGIQPTDTWANTNTHKSFLKLAVATTAAGSFKTNVLSSPGMDAATNTLSVSNAVFEVGDYLRVDSEVLKVTATNATTVTVLRAQAGTTGAAHTTASPIYALSDIMRWNLPIDTPSVHTNMVNVTNALSAALGSYAVTYVKLPVLFDKYGDHFVAGTANAVNCLVYPGQGIFMQDTGSVDFNTYISNHVSSVVFINIWDGYHCWWGEVHCGTATRRTISFTPPWWQALPGWQ